MIDRRTIGLNFRGPEEADFRIWAPYAKRVLIETAIGSHPLDQKNMGFWELKFFSLQPGARYMISIDGESLPDPASLSQPDGVEGKSMAFDPSAYSWNDKAWNGLSMNELIIYELHTGTFTHNGTFDALSEKIPYLKSLGITAIELMPVAEFPGKRNWGYDGVFPFAVHHSYGGPAALQRLTDICHQNNIGVILDVVINHLGPEGSTLPSFGPVFTDKYQTPWGKAINFDDAWCDGVRNFYIENIIMWLRDFHIDGIRLDAVHAIKDFSHKNILREIQEQVELLNEKSSFNHFIIAESDLNDVRYIAEFRHGGYGLDATWCDEFHHALHSMVTGENMGYYADFGNTSDMIRAYNEAFVYNGIWSPHRKQIFGTSTTGYPGHKFVVFSQNHDQIGNRMLGDRLSTQIDFEMLKVVAGAVLFSPFIPLLFMGEEYAEMQPFLYFINHNSEELIKKVREGRKKEFEAFTGTGSIPDPQSERTFQQSKLNWDSRTLEQLKMLAFYQELIHLRKTIPAWKSSDRNHFSAKSITGKKVLQLTRESPTEILLAILNFESIPVNVITCETHIPWQLILNSGDPEWGGADTSIDITNPAVSVPPHSMIVLYNV